MRILGWTGKPVIVLLNQLGAPRPAAQEQAEVQRWAELMSAYPWVHGTLAFDAFARCWVQEHTLLEHIGAALPAGERETFMRPGAAWRDRNEAVFRRSVDLLATEQAAVAYDGEVVATPTLGETARTWLAGIVRGDGAGASAGVEAAMRALATRADAHIRQATDGLIALHGLSGSAAAQIRARVAADFVVAAAADAGKAGVIGAAVSGALGGLIADLHPGGLTFGAGALVGGLLGAAGARSIAQGYNLMRGSDTSTVRWNHDVLSRLVAAAGLRYLAVAHFGRGRGDFVESEYPAHWRTGVEAALATEAETLTDIWAAADRGETAAALAQRLHAVIERVLRAVLADFY